jgi:hypothetical protein
MTLTATHQIRETKPQSGPNRTQKALEYMEDKMLSRFTIWSFIEIISTLQVRTNREDSRHVKLNVIS